MKTLHLFISSDRLDANTKFYFVPVGISRREQSQAHRLEVCAAVSPHVYWQRCSASTATFLQKVARQIWDGHKPADVSRLFRDYNLRRITPTDALKLANSFCYRETNKNLSHGRTK